MNDDKTVQYHSKIVGVTFEGRQEVIAGLNKKSPLQLRREADNKYDPNAVAVDAKVGDKWLPIGYIAKDKNSDLAELLDAGETAYIAISDITGGGDKSFGVNVLIEYKRQPVDVTIDDVQPQTTMDMLTQAIVEAMGGNYDIKISASPKETERYESRILGKVIDLKVVNGHKRLDGFLSGSKFPEQFYTEFEKDTILQKIADKFDVDKNAVETMWSINGVASTSYGTGVHAAMENYDTYRVLGDKIKSVKKFKTKPDEVGPNKALSRNPFLKKIVEDFHEKFGGDYVRFSEQFIWLTDKKLCGSIDRLKIIDAEKKIVRIQDFKTDSDIHEKKYQKTDSPFKKTVPETLLGYHWLQLSFYAYILQQYGYTVEGLDIYWLNPEKLAKGENAWEEFQGEVIDISKAL